MPSKPSKRASQAKTSRRSSAKPPSPWVATTAVLVKDRETSRKWYNQVLGLPTQMEMGHWTTVGQARKGGALHLCQVSELEPKGNLEPGNTGILLLLPGDFHERCEELKTRGVEFVVGPTQRPWGWDATIRDPDGNELLLMPEG